MFKAFVVGLFFLGLFWEVRRRRSAARESRRVELLLADGQRALEASQHRNQQLTGLLTELHEYRVSPAGRVSWQQLADFSVQMIRALLSVETVVLLRREGEAFEYRGVATRGLSPQQLADLRVPMGEGLLGRAAQAGKNVVVNEADPADPPAAHERFLSAPYLILPLRVQAQVNGLLALCKPPEGRWGAETIRLAGLFAKQIEVTLENLELYADRQRVYKEVVEMLGVAMEFKHRGTADHASRCRRLVRAMAQEMHLPELLTEQIELGAMLHDAGKLGVDEALLLKPDSFNEAEHDAVKKHSEMGYRILRPLSFLKSAAPIVLYHHEWFNGLGYPEGLAGEEIPLGSRMLAIADAWERMSTDQPYRKALAKNNAIAELRQQSGTQFDPKLVDVFLHVIDRWDRAPQPVSTASLNA